MAEAMVLGPALVAEWRRSTHPCIARTAAALVTGGTALTIDPIGDASAAVEEIAESVTTPPQKPESRVHAGLSRLESHTLLLRTEAGLWLATHPGAA